MDLKTALEECPIPGLTYPTAARWVQQGLVVAEGGGSQGRDFDIGPKQIRELRILTAWRQVLSFVALKRAVMILRGMGFSPLNTIHFAVVEGGELVRVVGEEEAIELLKQPSERHCAVVRLRE